MSDLECVECFTTALVQILAEAVPFEVVRPVRHRPLAREHS